MSQINAWLIALYAIELLVPIIDVLSLPLPRYAASISFSIIFMLAALAMLIPLAHLHRIPLLSNTELALIGLMLFCSGLEVAGSSGRGPIHFGLILDFIPLLLAMMAARLYLEVFNNFGFLVYALVITATLLLLMHTALLLIVAFGISMPFINLGELKGRNAIALLGPICLWLLAFFPIKGWHVFTLRYNLLLGLSLLNILLTSGRAAFLIFVWSIFVGIIIQLPKPRRWLRLLLLPVGVTAVIGTTLAYPILMQLGEMADFIVGHDDDAISALSRSQTNALLLYKSAQDILLGLGWDEVAAIKAHGYMGHTLYVNIFASYGIIGALAIACLLFFGFTRLTNSTREIAAHLLIVVILVASFSNNVFAYFGVIIALVELARTPHRLKETTKNAPEPQNFAR
ncbi:MAG: hypothetical protein ACK4FK_05555 [Ferrovibrio sp.]|uniref:hypothetical protein n=1 Tax=Ferrovibrio sp. TaxID=1917215 RepID=UPI00391A4762